MRLYRRLLHAFDNHGRRILNPPPPPKPGPNYSPAGPHPFDLSYGVDTSGHIPGESLPTGSPADLYNTAYYAISPSTLTQALAACALAAADFTFIDLGCGKGRALLVAAQYGFTRIIGVEIAENLARTARKNMATQLCAGFRSVEILTQDATALQYPADPLLLFLYHPFLAPMLRRTLRNLIAQVSTRPRPVYLLFACPSYARLLARIPQLTHVWTRTFPLSPEDAAADRHGITEERYALYLCVHAGSLH